MQGDEMRSKTLIGLAVASTFGWAAAAYAESDYQTGWTPSERYPSMAMFESDGTSDMSSSSAPAALSDGIYSEYYLVSWSPSSAAEWDHYVIASEPSSPDMFVLLDDGASVVPMHEVMGTGPETLVLLDDGASIVTTYGAKPSSSDTLLLLDDQAYIVSTYDVLLLPSDFTQPGGS
jgi:hypothetical protein